MDLQLICTFTRMMEALGLPKDQGKAGVTPEIISQVGRCSHLACIVVHEFLRSLPGCRKPQPVAALHLREHCLCMHGS